MNLEKILGIVGIYLVILTQGTFGQDNTTTQCLCLQDVIPQMELRTTVRMKPFPDGRILLAEKIGVLWIYSENFIRQPEPFGNFTHLIDFNLLDAGFQGVAIHPNFPEDGRIFVNFNRMDDFGDYATLRQYSIFPDDPDTIDLDSEVILIERSRSSNGSAQHSGGEVFFNTDGYLYVAYGDGSQGDPLYMAQNRGEMRGKMLRLDIDNVPEGQTYGIPPDNPFIDEEGTLPEIYALGFRQPWTISVDLGDPETGQGEGRIFLADCGQRSWEEIDLVVKGGNYGWSSREGFACYKHRYCGNIGPEEFPIAAYKHDEAKMLRYWCAIGGHVYRGELNPGLKAAYIHADAGIFRNLYVMRESSDGKWSHDMLPLCITQTCEDLGLTNRFLGNIASFGFDSYGEVYLLTSTTWDIGYGAAIQRLIDPETFVPS